MELKDWKFADVVDYAAGEILKGLIAGHFRTSVFNALEIAIRWRREQDK